MWLAEGVRAEDLLLSPDLPPAEAHRYLSEAGFRDAPRADERIQRLGEMVADRERLARLLPSLLAAFGPSPDPDLALLRLENYFEVSANRDALVGFLADNEGALEVLAVLFGSSAFLTQLLVRNPEYLYWLLAGRRLEAQPPPDYFRAQCRGALQLQAADSRLQALRRLHRREYLRIAAQDLLGSAGLPAVVGQVSDLADALLGAVFETLFPLEARPGDGFAVIAMGKLGGRELNFSSDVDLLYVYTDDSDPARMTRFARDFTKRLGEATGEGRLYRVDLRLRPMGRGGEIAYPLGAYRHYWETGAETFERLALIKARAVAGDPELGAQFERHARRFVYRKYLDQAALEEVAWLKQRSDREVERRDARQRDVKLGVGGIREVEFFVQALQILYGGRQQRLQVQGTLEALDRLVDGGFVEPDDYRRLKQAYVFLRDVEHRLQLAHDRQVQTLPKDEKELARMVKTMSGGPPPDLPDFLTRLTHHRENVRRLFRSLLEGETSSGLPRLMLDPRLETETAVRTLRGQGVRAPEAMWEALEQLRRAPAFPHSPARMRNLLANLLPALVEHAAPLEHPERLVSRLDRFCEALGARVQLLQELVEEAESAESLFRLLSLGEFLSGTLIRHPELLDSLLAGPPEPPGRSQLESYEAADSPATRRALFKRREEFKLAAWELAGGETQPVRRQLSALAELCLQDAGRDWCRQHREFDEARWTLFALGKLGGRELTYHSDLDLVLVYDEGGPGPSPPAWDGMVRWLKKELQTYTPEGPCYRLDFRLRPEGSKSAPATPLGQAARYFQERAEGWERLAYLELRPVDGRGEPIAPASLLQARPLTPAELDNVLHLRRRKEEELAQETPDQADFKVGAGGLLDLQLISRVARLRQDQDTLAREDLKTWWDFLLRLESTLRLQSEHPTSKLDREGESPELAARLLGLPDAAALWERYTQTVRQVRATCLGFFR